MNTQYSPKLEDRAPHSRGIDLQINRIKQTTNQISINEESRDQVIMKS